MEMPKGCAEPRAYAQEASFLGPDWSGPDRDKALLAADADIGIDPLADPGVVTLAGDWHGNLRFARDVIEAAQPGPSGRRVVLQLGDFGVWPGDEGAAFLNGIAECLARIDGILLFVDGNHEDHPQLSAFPLRPDGLRVLRPRLYHLPRAYRWQWHGRRWLALGGAHSIDRHTRTEGVDWWPGETLTKEDLDAAVSGGPVDYMVAHDCPAGVFIKGIRDPQVGQPKQLFEELVIEAEYRRELRDVVNAVRPEWYLHGHYHTRHKAILELDGGHLCTILGMGKTTAVEDNSCAFNLAAGAAGTEG